MRDRAADWVDRLVADNQVEVCSIRTERVIAGHANVRACLPPAMLAADDMRLKCVIHLGPRPHTASRGLNVYPVARADPALAGSQGVQLDLRIESLPSQTRQRPMLGLAKEGVLGAGEDQRDNARPGPVAMTD